MKEVMMTGVADRIESAPVDRVSAGLAWVEMAVESTVIGARFGQ
jgi:hypothetical protein